MFRSILALCAAAALCASPAHAQESRATRAQAEAMAWKR